MRRPKSDVIKVSAYHQPGCLYLSMWVRCMISSGVNKTSYVLGNLLNDTQHNGRRQGAIMSDISYLWATRETFGRQ